MDNETIIKTIKNLCKQNNITLGQMEKEVGLSQGLVSKWKDKTPSLDKIIDIADYFHVSIDEVIGRNQNSITDDFLNMLYNKTANKEIRWNYLDSYSQEIGIKDNIMPLSSFNNFLDEEGYYIYCEEHYQTSYYFKYLDGYITIYAMYPHYNITEPENLKLFIQPDLDAESVPQKYEYDELLPLWLKVIISLEDNAPAEVRAEDLKRRFASNKDNLSLNELSDLSDYMTSLSENENDVNDLISDEKTKQLIIEANSPEVQQLIKIFTEPKMLKTMQSAQKMINYFSEIKQLKNDKNK